jgi:hypothetical protein
MPAFEPGTSRMQVRRVSAVLICLTLPLPFVSASQFPLYVSCPNILKYEAKKTTKTNLNDLFPLWVRTRQHCVTEMIGLRYNASSL